MTSFFHVFPGTSDFIEVSEPVSGSSWEKIHCSACEKPIFGRLQPANAFVDKRTIGSNSMNVILDYGVLVLRGDFLDLFKNAAEQDLLIGKVYDSKSCEIDGYSTVIPKFETIIRGSENVAHRKCEGCRRVLYYGGGARHLATGLPNGVVCGGSDLPGLIFPSSLKSIKQFSKGHREILFEELEVVSPPLDGLPEII